MKAGDRFAPQKFYDYCMCSNCNIVTLNRGKVNEEFHTYNVRKEPTKSQLLVYSLFYRRLKKYKKNGNVLDFGSGTGFLAKFLSKKGYAVDCFEIDRNSKKWIENVQKLPIIEKVENNKYDVIISFYD